MKGFHIKNLILRKIVAINSEEALHISGNQNLP